MSPPGLSFVRLLQLVSPALPVGAFSYSQGLESAVEERVVVDEITALDWIGHSLEFNLGRFEAPLLARLVGAWREEDVDEVLRLNAIHLASRESAELRAETVQMGYSMARLLGELPDFPDAPRHALARLAEPGFPTAWSAAAAAWGIPREEAVAAYLWAWAENQTLAALKAVPLGQSAGQRMLMAVGGRLPQIARRASTLEPDAWSNLAPGLAIACSRHETQYSRLFRS